MNIFQKSLSNLVFTLPKRTFAFKSSICLENLYPGTNLNLTTPSMSPTKDNGFNGYIPIDKLEITYSKSTGPGGQNVNKVNTKVDVRFHLESADWLSTPIKTKLAAKFKTKITNEGFLIFRSDITRSQQLNLADCLQKIRTAVRNVEDNEPKVDPETPEKIRRRLEKAAQERLAVKRERSNIKMERKGPSIRDVL